MRHLPPVLLALLALVLAPAAARAGEAPVAEQIIVHHKPGLDAADRAEVRADSDTELERRMRLADTELVAVTEGTRAQALAALRADPDVEWAEPNTIVRPLVTDSFWNKLWGLFNPGDDDGSRIDADVDAQQAWTVTEGAGVTVAVVDTGVQANHPDLGGRVVAGYDFVDEDATPSDGHGHGTHVAGIVAATKGNGLGVAGLAPAAQIMPLKALPDSGYGTIADVAEAFDYAGDHGAQVVNASLGADGPVGTVLGQAIAGHPQTIFVVAAGNDGRNNDWYPTTPCVSTAANVLCVGATDGNDAAADFSNYGATTVDLFAPGVDILSTYKNSNYAWMDGTSMATPYAAGAAALVIAAAAAQSQTLTGAQVVERLKATVDKPAALAGLSVTGGRLNAARAVGATVDAPSTPVIQAVQGAAGSAVITMASRESDITGYIVLENGAPVATSSSRTIALSGVTPGAHTYTVIARNTSLLDSPASAPTTVTVGSPAPPAPERPGTIGDTTVPAPAPGTPPATTTPPATVTGVQLMTRGGRRSLVFRVTTATRVTVTLSRLRGGRYRKTGAKTVRMAAGLQSLPITSRLLGMRVPAGRWQVKVSTAGTPVATVAFTRR